MKSTMGTMTSELSIIIAPCRMPFCRGESWRGPSGGGWR
jgi:hypothetical protein